MNIDQARYRALIAMYPDHDIKVEALFPALTLRTAPTPRWFTWNGARTRKRLAGKLAAALGWCKL